MISEDAKLLVGVAIAGRTAREFDSGLRRICQQMAARTEDLERLLEVLAHTEILTVTVRTPTGTESRRIARVLGGWDQAAA